LLQATANDQNHPVFSTVALAYLTSAFRILGERVRVFQVKKRSDGRGTIYRALTGLSALWSVTLERSAAQKS
jgi:hypothetical protein